jgi:glycosyltransferase involved in cell wall biosynthesis
VHASTKPEPFGLTIVQAMACGRAVVAMQAGGSSELFTHDVDALGAPPNDPEALAAAIRKLTECGELRARLGEHAQRSALNRFSRTRLGPELMAVYKQVLSKKNAKSA